MTFDYAEAAADAATMLQDAGQPVTLTRPAAGAYDPDTGSMGSGEPLSFTGFGVALNYSAYETDGSLVQVGDRRLYIGADLGATPKPGDSLTLADGAVLRVMASKPLAPAGVIVLHDCQCRGL